MENDKCLQCDSIESKCKCDGGFKVAYHFGIPKSREELAKIPTLAQARREIDNIKKLLG